MVRRFGELLSARGFAVASGVFGAMMDVELVNQGPVTIVLSTDGW
jgi:D-tyrosyl-tRNA(Tyr) deacylase